jgi:hypothetical protein
VFSRFGRYIATSARCSSAAGVDAVEVVLTASPPWRATVSVRETLFFRTSAKAGQ